VRYKIHHFIIAVAASARKHLQLGVRSTSSLISCRAYCITRQAGQLSWWPTRPGARADFITLPRLNLSETASFFITISAWRTALSTVVHIKRK